MSSALNAGGRSGGSLSPEAKPNLDGTLMPALLALNTPDPCEVFVVRLLRDRPTPARVLRVRPGRGPELAKGRDRRGTGMAGHNGQRGHRRFC